ncbi:MAG: sugar transferase [Candidatus Latescibacteria bacterium]|nr:sugar transferase [Candidatus Latescibacterota bacterium]
MIKRTFDITVAVCGIVPLLPVMIAVATAVKLTSPGPVFYRQVRVGRNGRPFRIYKFRSMVCDAESRGGSLTIGGDARITPVGRFLRRHKLDEWPQLFNVLRGEMSLVGPRPEVPEFIEMYPESYKRILMVRPGMTSRTTLAFRNEEQLLAAVADPRRLYREKILPYKIMHASKSLQHQHLSEDVRTIVATIFNVVETITAEELDRAAADLPRVVRPAGRKAPDFVPEADVALEYEYAGSASGGST